MYEFLFPPPNLKYVFSTRRFSTESFFRFVDIFRASQIESKNYRKLRKNYLCPGVKAWFKCTEF